DGRGQSRLTTSERNRILLANIHGVDIDPQAVEVTKLSLLLKVLEQESAETVSLQLKLLHERALPDLENNIRCGNSLVSEDIQNGMMFSLLPPQVQERINPFNWKKEFPHVFKNGGFDVVVSNPPYSYRNATEEALRPYYESNYASTEGNFELYKFFLERSLKIARPGGRIGMIVSASFLVLPTFTKLRKVLLENATIDVLAPLGPKVFEDATVDTAIIAMKNTPPTKGSRTR